MNVIQEAISRLQSKTTFSKLEVNKAIKMYNALPANEEVVFTYFSYADNEQKYVVGKIARYYTLNRRGTKELNIQAVAKGHGTASGYLVVEPVDITKSWRA